jgi:hypothetical protein
MHHMSTRDQSRMIVRKKASKPELPAIIASSWKGEIVRSAHAPFGQQTQSGPRPHSVEFGYMIAPFVLTMPGNHFT